MTDIIIPSFNKIQEKAWALHEKIIAYKIQHPSLSWDEASFEVIKQLRNNPIRFQELSGTDKRWFWQLKDNYGIRILTSGWIETLRWNNESGKKPKNKWRKSDIVWRKVKGIHSAIRQQDHILEETYKFGTKYKNGELQILDSIQEILEYANRLLINWRYLDKGGRKELELKLAFVVLELERCRNEYKVETREKIKKAKFLRDSLGRINPGAMSARTLSALRNLNERFIQLGIIMPHIAMRKEALILEKRRMESTIKIAMGNPKIILRHPVFSNGTIKEYEISPICGRIDMTNFMLKNVRVSPYYEQTQQIMLYLEQAKKYFANNEFMKAKKMLNIAIEIYKSDLSRLG